MKGLRARRFTTLPTSPPFVPFAACAILALAPATARAAGKSPDAVQAEALFAEGRRLMAAGDYANACPKLADSESLDPAPGTVLNLAVCYERGNRLASAWAEYKNAEAAAEAAGQHGRALAATKRAADLEPRLSKLTVSVPTGSRVAGLEVLCDGAALTEPSWGVAVPRDGGGHDVEASAPGKMPWKTHVDLKPSGQALVVEVPGLEDAPAPVVTTEPSKAAADVPVPVEGQGPAPAPAPDRGHTQRLVGRVTVGAGIVGAGVGGILGLAAKSKDSSASGEAQPARYNDSVSAVHLGDVATVVAVAGGLVGAAGVVLWLTAPRAPVEVGTAGPTLFVRGTF